MKKLSIIALAAIAAIAVCAYQAPQKANEPLKVSIIGASIDTFEGYIPEDFRTYYPKKGKQGTPVTSVEQTWWWKIIYEKMSSAVLERNLSFSGASVTAATPSAILNYAPDGSTPYWVGYSASERFIAKDGLGDPDVILIHGGGNDLSHKAGYLYVTADGKRYTMDDTKEFPYSIMEEAFAKADAAEDYQAVCALCDSTFVDAYVKLTRLITFRHPKARVVHYFSEFLPPNMVNAMILTSKHYGHRFVDLRQWYTDCLRLDPSAKRPNGLHPSAEGMQLIADKVYELVGKYIEGKE